MQIDYSKRIFGLDLMRAIAILFVVGSHVLWVFPEVDGPLVTLLRLCGVMGVEIFFVLSGFLIGRILYRIFTNPEFKVADLKYFIIRRWFRTLPNYYLILLINIALVIYLGRQLPESLGYYFVFLQNFSSGMDIFFTESWSLPIEEFAYIVGPVLFYLAVLLWKTKNREWIFFWVTLAIIAFFLVTKVGYNSSTGSNTLDYWNINLKAVVLYRIDAIYYGVLAAFVSLKYAEFWKRTTFTFLFLGIILFVGLHILISNLGLTPQSHPFFINVLYLPMCSIFIAMSLPFLSRLKRVPNYLLKPITWVSLISYSMYLLHYSIILQLMRFYVSPTEISEPEKWLYTLSYLALTFLLSHILYRFFEKPMMDIRDRAYFKQKFQQQ
ncbi:MAG: acyltransferase [Flavobacteriaceae bacterium]|nr:acyltransferase [Flavobacteriaceae bacterium]